MKKKLIILGIILAFLALSSWGITRLIYTHKLPLGVAAVLSRIYNIKAGEVIEADVTYDIYLADYLRHYRSLESFGKNVPEFDVKNIPELAWQGVVKDLWVKNLSKNFEISVEDEELDKYLQANFSKDDLKSLEDFAKETYHLSLDKFKDKVVRADLLELKVYQRLLENYNDKEGITKAQEAYAELEAGEDFLSVAQKYSPTPETAETSIWLKEAELVDFYEPIKDLQVGEFSKIVIIPQAYLIWRLDNIVTDENNEKGWEVRSLLIGAKTMDDFFKQYFTITRFNKFY